MLSISFGLKVLRIELPEVAGAFGNEGEPLVPLLVTVARFELTAGKPSITTNGGTAVYELTPRIWILLLRTSN
ncbi:hypothetical protein D3C85_967100 [compost metagenome]